MLLLKRLDQRAIKPTRSYPDDAGLDMYIMEDTKLLAGEFKDIETGWAIKIADGFWGSVKARSSTFFKRDLIVHEGTIDPGYTGKLNIGVFNPSEYHTVIKAGERIAQLVILPLIIHPIKIVEELPNTMRGPEGFGSTGMGA